MYLDNINVLLEHFDDKRQKLGLKSIKCDMACLKKWHVLSISQQFFIYSLTLPKNLPQALLSNL